MILKRAPNLAAYVEELESTGQIWFRRDEAIEAMGVSHGAFLVKFGGDIEFQLGMINITIFL